MRFVAHALEQLERAALVRQPQRFFVAGPVNLLELLRQADDGNLIQTKLRQLRARRAELSFATVNENEVGQILVGRDVLSAPPRLARRASPTCLASPHPR